LVDVVVVVVLLVAIVAVVAIVAIVALVAIVAIVGVTSSLHYSITAFTSSLHHYGPLSTFAPAVRFSAGFRLRLNLCLLPFAFFPLP